MPPVQSTPTSPVSSDHAGGGGTNTHVGESKAKAPLQQQTTLHGSPSKWKTAGKPASSSTSTMNEERSSLLYDEEDTKRKAEMEGYLKAPEEKKKKRRAKQESSGESNG